MTSLRRLGTSDLHVFPVALGGNVFGWTADVYSAWAEGNEGGESETVIGRWLASRGNRSDIVVATKVGAHPRFKGLSATTIKAAAEESLRRLGTDHIDLYYTHFDDESVPVEEIVTALDQLVRDGKVRAVAASNISPERLRASLDFAEAEGLTRYVALQPHYNLVSRDTYEGPLLETVEHAGLSAVPYYGLAAGFLTGKYRPGADVDSVRSAGAVKHLDTERGRAVLAALDTVAGAHGAELATVALAWLASRPTVAAPIASARTVEQLPALVAAADLTLTETELALLTEASAL